MRRFDQCGRGPANLPLGPAQHRRMTLSVAHSRPQRPTQDRAEHPCPPVSLLPWNAQRRFSEEPRTHSADPGPHDDQPHVASEPSRPALFPRRRRAAIGRDRPRRPDRLRSIPDPTTPSHSDRGGSRRTRSVLVDLDRSASNGGGVAPRRRVQERRTTLRRGIRGGRTGLQRGRPSAETRGNPRDRGRRVDPTRGGRRVVRVRVGDALCHSSRSGFDKSCLLPLRRSCGYIGQRSIPA